ncbi:MAG: hypothetical protein ABI972_21800 [Acidobacteriota bacterium]
MIDVVAFHAFPAKIRGGFIGAGIFFVVSGVFISTIQLGSLEWGAFSFDRSVLKSYVPAA